jgi:two-component system response regulator RegA
VRQIVAAQRNSLRVKSPHEPNHHAYPGFPANADEIVAAFGHHANAVQPLNAQPSSVYRLEWEHIQRILQEHQGNISATARALNMHRRTLQRKLGKFPAP